MKQDTNFGLCYIYELLYCAELTYRRSHLRLFTLCITIYRLFIY